MGQQSSSNNIYYHIQTTVRDLIYKYKFWTNEEICDKLELVYYDKLIKLEKNAILDASVSIGLKNPRNMNSGELCQLIIRHYKERIDLLRKILDAVEKGIYKIKQVEKGPVCRSVDRYVEDFFTCGRYHGLWLSQEQYKDLLKNFKDNNRYSQWQDYLKQLKEKYYKYLKQLNDIIQIIKRDIDNKMSDESFEQLKNRVQIIIDRLTNISDILYLLMVNMN